MQNLLEKLPMENPMVLVNFIFKMMIIFKVLLKMETVREREGLLRLMEATMRAKLGIIRLMAMASIGMLMGFAIRGSGRIICPMGLGKPCILMAVDILGSFSTIKETEMASISSVDILSKDPSKTIKSMGFVNLLIKMDKDMKDSGVKDSNMEMALMYGQMGKNIKDNTNMIIDKELELCFIIKNRNILVSGKMGTNMERACFKIKDKKCMGFGLKVSWRKCYLELNYLFNNIYEIPFLFLNTQAHRQINNNQNIIPKSQKQSMTTQRTGDPVVENLQFMTLYIYRDSFLIEPNTKSTTINTNLIIDRKTQQFKEINKSSAIPGDYQRKATFSTFLGVLSILNKNFLVFVENCVKVCTIQEVDIFEVRDIGFVPFESEKQFQEEDQQKLRQIFDYMTYMKNQFMRQGFYFSYGYQLTLSRTAYAEGYPTRLKFAWNCNMGKSLIKLQQKGWFITLMQGSIKYFKYILQGKQIQYYLITRRSWKKGGTRYNERGLNNKGHVANFCQTQQIIFVNNYCFSHLQIRGSVPVFWKQTGIYAQVEFYNTHEDSKQAFRKHFQKMQKLYNKIFCINLLSKQKSGQIDLTLYFQKLIKQYNLDFVRYQFYDFHFACKGQKFQRSNMLIEKLNQINNHFKYYVEDVAEKKVISVQNGIMRTNCLDCLDRTNLVQTKIALDMLGTILSKCGFDIQSVFKASSILLAADDHQNSDQFIINLKNIWADNGDMISKHYTGTGSTHTNVTRTGKRDLMGMMDHGFKTLNRFYKQYMQDNFKQEVVDLILGEHTETINLKQFEIRMKNNKEESQLLEL